MSTEPLTFLVAGDPGQRTGGYGYDRRIAAELEELGRPVRLLGLPGRFPVVDARARVGTEQALAAVADDAVVIVDGLVFGALPEVMERHSRRLRLIALCHHPLADETGLDGGTRELLFERERQALAVAAAVIVTSPFTARRLHDLRCTDAIVITPGTDSAPASERRDGPPWRLLCVASVIPRKGHEVLVEALARLTAYDWQCRCVGGLEAAPDYVTEVRRAIAAHGLSTRIELVGSRAPAALEADYAAAALFVLPTRFEGYGMAFAEAVAHGLPVIAGNGGAVADTLAGTGARLVEPGDVGALMAALEAFFVDADTRNAMAATAQTARTRLPGWAERAVAFERVVQAVGE